MSYTDMQNKKIHQGRNIKRFREMLGIKQEALAFELGNDWNQKKISLLEQKETVESDILAKVAQILKVPAEAIENFDEEQAVNIISNTFTSNDTSTLNAINVQPTFNPLDKLIESYEEIKRLNKELIEGKNEQIKLLEQLLKIK